MIAVTPNPGAVVRIRSANWKILSTRTTERGYRIVHCRGLSGITKDKEAQFVWEKEQGSTVLDPAAVRLVPDTSSGLIDTKLFLAAAFRSTPSTSRRPLTLGRAAIDDLKFQHIPVEMALKQDRVRLLIADDVGLGKTLEAGLIASELALRARANRILVVTTRAMLTQFQKEFWTRFSIPLARLDSAAIRRMRNRIPAHYNVFGQFERSIVSIDTLKKDGQIRAAIEESYWDLIIIDEAHNAANRAKNSGNTALRAKLAQLLARRADSLLLLTATPHDGSQDSFASLIEMLDPTRVPDPSKLRRHDIEDLVVRRFRSSPEIVEELRDVTKKRELHRRHFALSQEEEVAYQGIADLHLDLDEEARRGRAIDLFRTTLAKAIFSSPAACLETLTRRIQGIDQGTARGTPDDRQRLQELAHQVAAIDISAFSKYQDLLRLLQDIGWTGRDRRDRLVIFSERIKTVALLEERLKADLSLSDDQIARVDGGSAEADTQTQKILEDFGQEKTPLRILIASDMASEGLNLHFQCHRLIQFDLPWSLLRFQQRNGRIDRYGQDRSPQIYYFVGESTHPKVRQMWVLEKLVEKDEAAQQGIGDPAVFLGVGDADAEEVVVAEAIAQGIGGETFSAQMDARAIEAQRHLSVDDEFAVLFGDYAGTTNEFEPVEATSLDGEPPRLFKDTFTYATTMLERLSEPGQGLFDDRPNIDHNNRLIRMKIPVDMLATDTLGYSQEGSVDDRYMPEEAVARGNRIELTDDAQVMNRAIAAAKMEERAWPTMQFLWEGHPILQWFADRAEVFFPDHAAPVAPLRDRLAPGETAVILHGAIPNARGAPVVDRWAVVSLKPNGSIEIDEVNDFVARVRLTGNTPNGSIDDLAACRDAVTRAVDTFQTHLVELRKAQKIEIEKDLDQVMERLAQFETRFRDQLSLNFGDIESEAATLGAAARRRLTLRQNKEKQIDQLFNDWADWFDTTRRMVDDPNPYVDVKAVFVG